MLLTNDPAKLAEMLRWPDEDLAAFLLGLYVLAEAQARGLDVSDVSAIPEEFAKSVCLALAHAETDRVDVIPLEKAIHYAASGDFARAGRLFRDYILRGAHEIRVRRLADVGLQIKRARQAGGRAAKQGKARQGKARQGKGPETARKVQREYERLRTAGRSDPGLTDIIARKLGLSPQYVNRLRKKLNLR